MKRMLYTADSANYPRLKTDTFFVDYSNKYSFKGYIDKSIKFIEDIQLLDPALWKRFVQQFREDSDYEGGWRGEYWGKLMRGAAFTYSYTNNRLLYDIMTQTVRDILECADEYGRISSYAVNHEFDAWDIWGRKYVLLGLQYYLEICEDNNLAERIIESMQIQTDYIISKIGKREDGKKPITSATRHWRGLNSSSLLEPVVRLYSITKKQKYLDFATYIVDEGGTDIVNIFDLAYENKLLPYQYPVTKAYEMMSCFEGLMEYYRITKNEKHKISIINFADRILETDFTIIGSCGCTHELFDHSSVRQANTTNGQLAQETCVTVTLMKFMYQLTLLTGDSKYADAFEISMYNAFLGSINTEENITELIKENHPQLCHKPMPFDSYSPLTAGKRGEAIGGFKVMSDNHYYGCCACIGAAANGLIPKMTLLSTKKGFVLNLFISGRITSKTPENNDIIFVTETEYPEKGKVKTTVNMEKSESFQLLIRNPHWSKETKLFINEKEVSVNNGYILIEKIWNNGDTIELMLDMRTEAIYPISYGTQILMNNVIWGYNYVVPTFDEEDPIAKNHIALRRGPVMLAQENRLGYSVDDPINLKISGDGYVAAVIPKVQTAPYEHMVEVTVPLKNGQMMSLTDYASAGKLWSKESKMAVWMLTENM